MTVILVRHGRSTANTSGVLAGRSPGVALDDKGRAQAAELVGRLTSCLPAITAVARSPLQRCAETVAPLLAALTADGRDVPEVVIDDLAEVDYGSWTNRTIRELRSEPLWKTVQQHPSAAVFPDGEGLATVQARAVAAIRDLDRRYGGPDGAGVWVACSHGDVIKSVIADAMGTHLDSFQRIVVEPASVSIIRYSDVRPFVHTVNSTASLTIPMRKPESDDAVVGGDRGTDGPAEAPAVAAAGGHHG
ncbi:MSMEG_4193 family putative phosphomutase [Gordonia sp. NPDC003950]